MAAKNPLYATFDELQNLLRDRRVARQILDGYPERLDRKELLGWIEIYQEGRLGVEETKLLNRLNDSPAVQGLLKGD